ncbi:MAG: hypothetical protein EOO07_32030 [Chitinophagaceae bacterium]|nr:MAG: hypothetical protein EOO07_32030 [Chitinophagaceae bacterium]
MSPSKPNLAHFNRARAYSAYIITLFVLLYVLTQFLLDKIENNALLQASIVIFNIFVLALFTLLGTYHILKSYTGTEAFHPHKLLYLGGYLIAIIVIFVLAQESYYKIYYILN